MPPSATVHHVQRGSIGRFAGLGVANTALTSLLFTALQHVTRVTAAYTIAFAAGLLFSTAFSAQVVFRVSSGRRRRVAFAGCYALIYAVGLLVSHAVHGHVAPWQVCAATIAVTAPLGYLAGRVFLVPPPGTRRSP